MLRPGTMMVSRAGEQLARRQCLCCGEELNAHQAVSSGVCDRQPCQDWKIEQAGAALLQRRRRELRARLFHEAASAIERVSSDLEADPAAEIRAVLPWQPGQLAPQESDRLAAFQAHLDEIVEQGFAEPAAESSANADAPGRAEIEAPEAALLSAACAICAGHCCDRGGTTGMLTPVDILRWRAREPGASKEQAVEAFASCLPQESVAGSCVYLGADGCALPRRMRSDWCNRFQCRERVALADAVAEADQAQVLMVAYSRTADQLGAVGGWSPTSGAVLLAAEQPAAEGDSGKG